MAEKEEVEGTLSGGEAAVVAGMEAEGGRRCEGGEAGGRSD